MSPRNSPYPPGAPGEPHRLRSTDFVLYLDLDGVVQHEAVLFHPRRGIYMSPAEAPERSLFEWTHFLEVALEPYPEVALVLSSTWCIQPGYGRTLKRLPVSLQSRFIGGTYHRRIHGADPWGQSAFRALSRGMQIWADVQRRQPKQWLALDDDTEGWPAWAQDNLIACDGKTGLSSVRVQVELKEKLRRCHQALAGG